MRSHRRVTCLPRGSRRWSNGFAATRRSDGSTHGAGGGHGRSRPPGRPFFADLSGPPAVTILKHGPRRPRNPPCRNRDSLPFAGTATSFLPPGPAEVIG